jgi:hypothetical protein
MSRGSFKGCVLTFEASPLAVATPGVTTCSVTDPLDFTDWPTDATILSPYLVPTGWKWTERTSSIEGDLKVSGLSFSVHDLAIAGQRPITRLATRTKENVGYTQLAQSLASGALTAWVTNGNKLGSFPRVIYIGEEAILCDSINTGTGEVTINASGRAYYGTADRAHLIDLATGSSPIVWKDFFGFYGRKVILWICDSNDIVTPVWRGFVKDRKTSEKDTYYTFDCEHLWQRERERPLGIPSVSTRIRGCDPDLLWWQVTMPEPYGFRAYDFSGVRTGVDDIPNSLTEACSVKTDRMRTLIIAAQTAAGAPTPNDFDAEIYTDADGTAFRYTCVRGITASPSIEFRIGGQGGPWSATDLDTDGTDPRTASARLDIVPTILWRFTPRAADRLVAITSVEGLPSVWSDTAHLDLGNHTSVRYVLRGQISDGVWMVCEPSAASSGATGPLLRGNWYIEGQGISPDDRNPRTLIQPFDMQVQVLIDSDHWAYALKRGIIEQTGVIQSGIDSASFGWDMLGALVRETSGGPVARRLFLDGQCRLSDLVGEACKIHGAGLGIRAGGRFSLFPFYTPMATDAVTLTVSTDDHVEMPVGEIMPEGVVNIAVLRGSSVTIVVNDKVSQEMNGPGTPTSVDLEGIGNTASIPVQQLMQYAMSRMIGLWKDPVGWCRVVRSILDLVDPAAAKTGDLLEVTEIAIPRGDGERGLDAARGQINERECCISFDPEAPSYVAYGALLYPHTGLAGYVPAAKIASISLKTLTLDDNYLTESSTATDYAASNRAEYPYADTRPNDGGASTIRVGDKFNIVQIDTDIPFTPEMVTVTSVDTAAQQVSVTPAPSVTVTTALAGGAWVDLEPVDYDDASDYQRQFCYIADQTTDTIGTNAVPAQKFGP